jgi:hypothetical protein
MPRTSLADTLDVDTLLARLALGDTLTTIAKAMDVDRTRLHQVIAADPDLSARVAEAKAIGIDAREDSIMRIVDGDDLDDQVEIMLDGSVRGFGSRKVKLAAAGGDPVARARLRAEYTLKILAVKDPARYGNKVMHAGHDGGAIKHDTMLSIKALAEGLRNAAATRVIDVAGVAAPALPDKRELPDASDYI